jgi:hypothetical protein
MLIGYGDYYSRNMTADWTTGVLSPAEAKDFFSSLCVQTSSEAHPPSYPMGTGGRFVGVKRGRFVTLATHPHLVPMSRMSRSNISSPRWRLHGNSGQLYLQSRYVNPPGILYLDLSPTVRICCNWYRIIKSCLERIGLVLSGTFC